MATTPPITKPVDGHQQGRILRFIGAYQRSKGWSPTDREIAEALGIRRQTVARHIQTLIQSGHLQPRRNRHRHLEFTIAGNAWIGHQG